MDDGAASTRLLRGIGLEPLPAPLWTIILQRAALALGGLVTAGVTAMFLLLAILPRSGAYSTYSVLTASMEPAIRSGSVVVVLPKDPASIRAGDIITVTSDRPPYATITHRVSRVVSTSRGPEFKTKGDRNRLEDPWQFGYNGPAGRVALVLPFVGYALLAAGSVWVRLALAGGIGLLVVAFFMPAIWRSRQPETGGRPASAPLA